MRIGVYSDCVYRKLSSGVYGERSFAVFLGELANEFDQVTIFGRLNPSLGNQGRYKLPEAVKFVGFPYYNSLLDGKQAAIAMAQAVRMFWVALDNLDSVWLLGPHPMAILFVFLARLRGKQIILGVRQNTPEYMRTRYPKRRDLQLIGTLLDGMWRLISRRYPTLVVGKELGQRYSRAKRLFILSVSLVRQSQIRKASFQMDSSYNADLQVISVGRLDTEKNPLLLAHTFSLLPQRWKLLVCGEGSLEHELSDTVESLGLADRVKMLGYVTLDGDLESIYRNSHVFFHVSWTEGVPQVLFEAFAAGIPVVATAVGGVASAVEDAALLIPPGDPQAAADALETIAFDHNLRNQLISNGLRIASRHSLENESHSTALFIRGHEPTFFEE